MRSVFLFSASLIGEIKRIPAYDADFRLWYNVNG